MSSTETELTDTLKAVASYLKQPLTTSLESYIANLTPRERTGLRGHARLKELQLRTPCSEEELMRTNWQGVPGPYLALLMADAVD